MSEHDDFGAFLVGFLIGGLTGAAVALLFAPQSGEQTRVYIRDQAIELADKAQETAKTVSKQVAETADVTVGRVNEMTADARTRLEEAAKKGAAVLEEQKTKVTEVVQNIAKPKNEAQAE